MSQLSPPLYTKNLFSLKFETGSYLLKSMVKNSVHVGKIYQISQHSEFSLKTFFALSLQLKNIYQSMQVTALVPLFNLWSFSHNF